MGDLLVVEIFELAEGQFEAFVLHDELDLDVEVGVVEHCAHPLLYEVLQPSLVLVGRGDLVLAVD